MGTVRFTANLERHLSVPPAPVEGEAVADALDAVFARNPRLRSYIVDEHGCLRRHVNVYVNDAMVADRFRLSDPVRPGDKVFIFQALSGGLP